MRTKWPWRSMRWWCAWRAPPLVAMAGWATKRSALAARRYSIWPRRAGAKAQTARGVCASRAARRSKSMRPYPYSSTAGHAHRACARKLERSACGWWLCSHGSSSEPRVGSPGPSRPSLRREPQRHRYASDGHGTTRQVAPHAERAARASALRVRPHRGAGAWCARQRGERSGARTQRRVERTREPGCRWWRR